MPDPITKATWDNYACISPAMAKALDAGNHEMELSTQNEIVTSKRVLKVTVNGKSLELPAVVVPGMHSDVVAVALGYGRSETVGRAAANTGKNAFPFQVWNGVTFEHASPNASVEKTARHEDVAITQTHHSYEGRAIIHEYALDDFAKDPQHLMKHREEELGHFAHLPWVGSHDEGHEAGHGEAAAHGAEAAAHAGTSGPVTEADMARHEKFEQGFRENGTLYPEYVMPGIHWGRSIDLNSCIGCGACVIGCQAENNVSVVGKAKVLRSQEMHWITIDRYFAGDPNDSDSIQTIFQPMMCQHCDNAPCENVCPVSATNHSSEGLNQMAYNRCIGTKYCANNCPYKVRHFNWMDWNGADCFADNLYEDGRRDDMNDDLTRMVLNPDVTVRSRGVMEKCTFCVQRLQDAKLAAKKAGRPMRDGEARTACQQACPTDAILFGNVNDTSSAIYNLRHKEQMERTFYVLEDLHTLPNVNYLSKVRNTDRIVAGNEATDIIMDKHI
jgi:molybdopterin-containing oxidoreductase family iron-sulfur binding subunit